MFGIVILVAVYFAASRSMRRCELPQRRETNRKCNAASGLRVTGEFKGRRDMKSKSRASVMKWMALGATLIAAMGTTPATVAQDGSEPAIVQGRTGPGLGENGKFRVVLVNSFIGNDWRVQMQNSAEIASKKEPYASEWEFSILNTDNTAEAQNAALENLLAQGVDAILLDSQSDTNAAEIVKRACEQNIMVVSFDVPQQVSASCHVRIEPDFFEASKVTGRWVGNALGCQGNVIMDRGLQGVSIADDIYNGNLEGMKEVCGDSIKIVGDYYGEFSATKQEGLISALLASNRDVQGVLGQADCVTIASAFADAELPMPVLRCAGSNANLVLCVRRMNCIASSNTPVSIGQWSWPTTC